jgi:RNA polymerase sigma-70 factor (ECF subfamily)
VEHPGDQERHDSESDDRLMVSVQQGRLSDLDRLFERHHRPLFQFFLRLTGDRQASEDLVQDVFLRMLRYRATYQPFSQFRTWMYQLARNAHIDRFKRTRRVVGLEEAPGEPASPAPHPGEILERTRELATLRRALTRLSHEHREVLILSRFHGLSYRQVGEVVGCAEGTVKVRVFRAMQQLRRIVDEVGAGS